MMEWKIQEEVAGKLISVLFEYDKSGKNDDKIND